MNRELFEKIANSDIALHSSFAVWDDSDITNIKVISSSVDKLTSEIVIVGLNPSGSKKTNLENRLRNFHWKYRGCKDYYLRAAFQQPSSRFKGAFMTDIVIDNPSKSQTSVKVSITSLRRFIDELECIQFFTIPN
ncbi:MAG: hypothetical protein HYR76_03515, partial [Ignavibacteria bacterium]|nr:hypothetical protein [Ignavibacteria bacterium]